MKIYLIRHGETPWNKEKRFQGQIDIPLNDYGREIAEITRQAMPYVPYDRVFSSPLVRARETADILLRGREGLQVEVDDRLKEFSFGSYEGTLIADVANNPEHPLYDCLWHPDTYHAPEGAESFTDLVHRAQQFIDDRLLLLSQDPTCHNVLITAHGAFNRAVVVAVGHKDIADFWTIPYYNCAVTILDLTDGRFTLLQEAKIYYDAQTDPFSNGKQK
jgi:probable phosphoglycerate mutase